MPAAHGRTPRKRMHELRDRGLLKALLLRTRYRRARMMSDNARKRTTAQPTRVAPLKESLEGWKQELSSSHVVSNYGQILTRVVVAGSDDAWAAGSLLPTSGCTYWRVRVARKQHEGGLLCIGVCDADSSCGWGLHLGSGRLLRFIRNVATGHVDTIDVGPPPIGLPDMRGRKMIVDPETGDATRVQGPIEGAILTCSFDADGGTFSIAVNGGVSQIALRSLPKRVALRPWARLAHATDQVEIEFDRLLVGSGRARFQLQRLLGRPRAPRLPRLQRV